MNFADIVKRALKRQKKTQRDLAAALGVTPQNVTKIIKNPTLDTINRIDAVVPIWDDLRDLYGANVDVLPADLLAPLRDPQTREDFLRVVQAIAQSSPEVRRAILHLIESMPHK